MSKALEEKKNKHFISDRSSFLMSDSPVLLRSHTSISSYRNKNIIEKNTIFPYINNKALEYRKSKIGKNDFKLESSPVRTFMFSRFDIERNKKRLERANERGDLSDDLMSVKKFFSQQISISFCKFKICLHFNYYIIF